MINSIFGSLDISSAGVSVERSKMNLISENIANAETTRTANGQPYRRKLAVVENGMGDDEENFSTKLHQARLQLASSDQAHIPEAQIQSADNECAKTGVHVSEVTEDPSPYRMVYDPSHPDANAEGYVAMPNVNIVQEMTDLISTSRTFDANVTAISSTKDMLRKAIKI